MLAIDIESGLTEAWERIATFIPKLLGFLVILIIGYFVAKLVAKVVDGLLERIGFDRWVERGALKTGPSSKPPTSYPSLRSGRYS